MSEYIIETHNLTKRYGNQVSVSNLNIHVKQGRIYGLLGRNGAGKTTTMRMLLGLTAPTSGEVKIFGRPMQGKIQLKATVLYQLPFSILPVSKLKVTNSSVVHAWTGYDPKNTDNEGTDGGEMVYVTEYESVYHTSESCTHLDLSVHRGTKTQVEQKRNEYGGKYHACERCGGDSALVYYTEKGDCYHSQASCSGLKRTVRLVKKSEIQAYIQCERCRENAG